MAANESERAGDGDHAVLTERFYVALREIAERTFRSERAGHTLQPTAAVNEACLRMMTTSPLDAGSRTERLALAARVLEQVLVDHSRRRGAAKRGGDRLRVELHPELSVAVETEVDADALHSALSRLRALHERQAEVVTLRIYGGLAVSEVATTLGVSKRTVESDWTVARAWLRRALVAGGAA